MLKSVISHFSCLLLIVIIAGCNSTGSYTSNDKFDKTIIGPIEKKAFAYQGIYRNPIIIVHGFLGSNLINKYTKENYWGHFIGANALGISDKRMRGLSIPMEKGKPLIDLTDDTIPDGMLDTVSVKIMGVTFKQNAYLNLVNILKEGGFQPENQPLGKGKTYNTLFQFAYDWRRDCSGTPLNSTNSF